MIEQRFEVLLTEQGWIAQTHCDCGTTRTSDPEASPTAAVERVNESFGEHLSDSARSGTLDGCGTANHQRSVSCRCEQCKTHDRQLAKLVSP